MACLLLFYSLMQRGLQQTIVLEDVIEGYVIELAKKDCVVRRPPD
jgi:hypothetical protein